MQQLIHKIGATVAAFLLIAAGSVLFTSEVSAQGMLEPRGDDDTREYEDDDDEDREDLDDYDDDDDLPVPVLFGELTDEIYPSFGDPRGGGSREHEGLDIMAPVGTPIVSPTEAEVLRIGEYSGAGNFVITRSDSGERFYYYHLEDQADYLDRGDDLEVGELIGYVGHSGNALESAPHLHLEIHDGRDVLDPYPRITRDFTLSEKMSILEGVFSDADDPDDLAELLVEAFSSVFIQAHLDGLEVPEEIIDELPEDSLDTTPPARNLTVGSEGDDVSALQRRLITGGYLDIDNPTGRFGPLTESSLAAYQRDNGIQPASGYYGPITREHMTDPTPATDYDIESMTQEELLELIDTLQAQLATLQAQL